MRRGLRAADAAGLRAAARPGRGPLGPALRALTGLADGAGLWMGVAAVLAAAGGRRGRRAAGHGLAGVAGASALANGALKALVRRRRPGPLATAGIPAWGRPPRTSSFPSGHTASAVAFAVAAGPELPPLAPLLGLAAAAVGWSRLAGGRHFPTDVAGGALVGAAAGLAARRAGRLVAPGAGAQGSDGPTEPVGG